MIQVRVSRFKSKVLRLPHNIRLKLDGATITPVHTVWKITTAET